MLNALEDLALFGLLGALGFHFWIAPSERVLKLCKRLVWIGGLIALARFLVNAAAMAESWAPASLLQVANGTEFGKLSVLKLAAVTFAGLLLAVESIPRALAFCASIPLLHALSSHPAAQGGTLAITAIIAVGAELIHVLAVSLWTGGALALAIVLKEGKGDPLGAALRFSRLAAYAVAAVGLSALALAWQAGLRLEFPSPFGSIIQSDYGKLVLLKSGLFTLVLGAGALNHFVHLRKAGLSDAERVRRVYRELKIELGLIGVIYVAAGYLAQTPLPH